MGILPEIFANRHVILPVIHVTAQEQAERNMDIAFAAGADGVFLINHSLADQDLLNIHTAVTAAYPDYWVGVNCLGLSPEEAFQQISDRVSGLWVDNARIDERQPAQPAAERIRSLQQAHAPRCLYFGGVAFKYQREVNDLETACRLAAPYIDVVTTSGAGTGHAADIEKIQRMRSALGDKPLAIASGITPENVTEYLPYADCFLVATGISQSFTELDPTKVRELIDRVRQF